jgi:hypothetical protein
LTDCCRRQTSLLMGTRANTQTCLSQYSVRRHAKNAQAFFFTLEADDACNRCKTAVDRNRHQTCTHIIPDNKTAQMPPHKENKPSLNRTNRPRPNPWQGSQNAIVCMRETGCMPRTRMMPCTRMAQGRKRHMVPWPMDVRNGFGCNCARNHHTDKPPWIACAHASLKRQKKHLYEHKKLTPSTQSLHANKTWGELA